MVCRETLQRSVIRMPVKHPCPACPRMTKAGPARQCPTLPGEERTGMAKSDLRKLACPACGHETAYDPRDCPRFMRFVGRPDEGRRKEVVVYRVRCAGCGKEHDVAAGKA